MEENKSTTQEQIKPFTIDHDYAMRNQQSSMVPGESNDEQSVADDLKIPDKEIKKTDTIPEEKVEELKKRPTLRDGMKKMFSLLPEGSKDPNHKMYLVLLYIPSMEDNIEDSKDFFFKTGRQAVYDRIKELLEENPNIDCMKSLIFVDSPNITISNRTSVYSFMKDVRERKSVIDDTSFDIRDFYYDPGDEDTEREDE